MITKNWIQTKWKFLILFTFLSIGASAQNDKVKVIFKAEDNITSQNPFKDYVCGMNSAPAFGDADNDGDIDLIVGYTAYALYYENDNGLFQSGFPGKRMSNSRFSPFPASMDQFRFAYGDLSGDGKTEGVCVKDGRLHYVVPYYKDKSKSSLGDLISGNGYPFSTQAPYIADVNNDGKLDIISRTIQSANGPQYVTYIPNETKKGSALKFGKEKTITSIPKTAVAPAFADLDKDGDLDIVYGNSDGTFYYYENIGSKENPSYKEFGPTDSNNPFVGFDVGEGAYPSFFDVDGDGDLDLFSGAKDGRIHFFENTTDEFCSPGNPENIRWEILNTGDFNGTITSVATDNSGNVYVAGKFYSIGGLKGNTFGIAKWDVKSREWIKIIDEWSEVSISIGKKVVHDPSTDAIYFAINWCSSMDCVSSVYKVDASKGANTGRFLPTGHLPGQWFTNIILDLAVKDGKVLVSFGQIDYVLHTATDGELVYWPDDTDNPDKLYADTATAFQSAAFDQEMDIYFTEVAYNASNELDGTFYSYNDEKNIARKTVSDVYPYFKASMGPQNKWVYEYGSNRNSMKLEIDNNWFNYGSPLSFPITKPTYIFSIAQTSLGDDLYLVHNRGPLRFTLNHLGPSTNFKPETKVVYNNTNDFKPEIHFLHVDNEENLYMVGEFENPDGKSSTRIVKRRFVPCIEKKQKKYTIESSFAKLDQPCEVLITDKGGNLYAGGEFTSISNDQGTFNCKGIAKWDASDKKWSNLGKGIDGLVECFAFDPDGNLIVGGDFARVDGKQISCIAKWDTKKESWSPFGEGHEIPVECNSIAFDSKGTLYIAGGDEFNAGYVSYRQETYWQSLQEESHWAEGWSAQNIMFDNNGDLLIEVHGFYTSTKGAEPIEATAVLKWLMKEQKYAEEFVFFDEESEEFTGRFCGDDCDNRLLSMQSDEPDVNSNLYLLPPDANVNSKDKKLLTQKGPIQFVLFGKFFYGISSDGFFRYKQHSHEKVATVKDASNVYRSLTGNPNDGFYTSVKSKGPVYTIDKIVEQK